MDHAAISAARALGRGVAAAYTRGGFSLALDAMLEAAAPLAAISRITCVCLIRHAPHGLLLGSSSHDNTRVSRAEGGGYTAFVPSFPERWDEAHSIPDLWNGAPPGSASPLARHHSQLGLPFLLEGQALYYAMFWADTRDYFTQERQAWLRALVEPLGAVVEGSLFIPSRAVSGSHHGNAGDALTQCPDMAAILEKIRNVARSDTTMLISGETGVGKEVVADFIHENSPRKSGPFIKVNCAALPESLLASALFGHEKGAFTGAAARTAGYFESAHGGAILLDEVGELSPEAQGSLLRVLDRKEIQRIGGSHAVPVDIRIIAATNRNLPDMVAAGTFRADLWYRLSVYPVFIPPLRERPRDIPVLARHYLAFFTKRLNLARLPIVKASELRRLQHHAWPGNVRELAHVTERALVTHSADDTIARPVSFELDAARLFASSPSPVPVPAARGEKARAGEPWERMDTLPTLERLEERYIDWVLRHTRNKVHGKGGAAEILGVHPHTVRYRQKKQKERSAKNAGADTL